MGLFGSLFDAGKQFLGSDIGQGLLGGLKSSIGGENYGKLSSFGNNVGRGISAFEDTVCRKRAPEEFQLPSKYQRYLDQGQGIYNQGRAIYNQGQGLYNQGQGLYNQGQNLYGNTMALGNSIGGGFY